MSDLYNKLTSDNLKFKYRKQQKEELKQKQLEEERKNANILERIGYTIADVATEIGGGFFKTIEGIVDSVASVAGGISTLVYGDDQGIGDFIKKDYTQDLYYSWEDKTTNKSFLNDKAPIVKDIVRGVGQQLPSIASIALAPVTGGTSLVALPYTVAGTVLSAGGTGMEEALNEGASYGQAMAYGGTQMAVEGVAEAVTGGLGKGITALGKGASKTVSKTLGKTMLEEAFSEATEEGLSAILNPVVKSIYKEQDLKSIYSDMTFWLDAGQQALVGGVVGGLVGGAGDIAQSRVAGGRNNYSIAQSIAELNMLDTKENNLWKNNKLDSVKESEINSQRQAELKNISNKLKSLDSESRAETMKKYQLNNLFDDLGNIKTESYDESLTQNRKPVASDNKEAYSPNVRNQELIHAPTKNSISDAARITKNTIMALNSNARLVIADEITGHAFYDTKSKTYYISNTSSEVEIAEKIGGHEFTHSLEGTKEYAKLVDFIKKTDVDFNKKVQQKVHDYSEVNTALKEGDAGQLVSLYEAETEVVADVMGQLISNPESIQRLSTQNKNIFVRIYSWIKDSITKLTKRGVDGEYYRYLRKLEKLYADAMVRSVGGVSLSEIRTRADQLLEEQKAYEMLKKLVDEENSLDESKPIDYTGEKAEARYSLEGDNYGERDSVYRGLSVSSNIQRSKGDRRGTKIKRVAEECGINEKEIYTDARTEEQQNIKYLASKEDINIYFLPIKTIKKFVSIDNDVFIREDLTENNFAEYLNEVKPIDVNVGLSKTAKPSIERLNYMSKKYGNKLYITRISVDQFLEMSTSGAADIRNIYNAVEQNYKNKSIEDIKNTVSDTEEDILLELDLSQNKITAHNGRHRLFGLKKLGNVFVDVFVIAENKGDLLSVNVEGQFNSKKYKLSLLNVNNRNEVLINNIFLRNDNNVRYSLKETEYGSGYDVKGFNTDEYTLINFKENQHLDKFKSLLEKMESHIKNNDSLAKTTSTRIEMYQTLKQQKNGVYSKFVEVNEAQTKTREEYQKNANIDIKKTFIQALKYNGVLDGENSVLYDIENKKHDLLDYSEERAKERLDKAIELFGETTDPLKAGWLLSDGRFVDYNRDSTNILKEQNDNFILDYRDHFQIEAVYETKRGYDAIDSFMAEGNIRLMPEAGGIELRRKPNSNQIDSLRKYIDSIIDKNDILVDLRKPNTSENTLTNYVVYDSEHDSKTVINDINAFYNTGRMPRVIDGRRYSLDNEYKYSKGQVSKIKAEYSKLKSYSKVDAEKVVNTIVADKLSFGNKYGEISNKALSQVTDTLWQVFNTKDAGYRAGVAMDIADFILDNTFMNDVYGDSTYDYDKYVIGELKDYLHNIDLSGVKAEIKYRYDKDNSVYAMWGKRSGTKGLNLATIAQELTERGINIEAENDADLLFEIDDMYRQAKNNLKKAVKERYRDFASKEDQKLLKDELTREILLAYDETGHKTKFNETIKKYTDKVSSLKNALREEKVRNKAQNGVVSTIERLRDEFVKNKPAGWKVPQEVVDFVKDIAKVETWRNNISKNARSYIAELSQKIDLIMDESQQQIYPYREIIKEIATGKGDLTTQELVNLDNVLQQFAWQLRNFDKVTFEGKVQTNSELSAQGVKEAKQAKSILKKQNSLLNKLRNKVYSNPFDRLSEIGLYKDSSITVRIYRDMLNGDRRRASLLKDVGDLFAPFYKKNKNYLKQLQQTISLHDGRLTMTKRQALSLYCTSLREQGRSHLFNLTEDTGVIRLIDNKLSTKGKMDEALVKGQDINISAETIKEIKSQLSEADIEYLKLVDQFFNKISKEAKKTTDVQLYGITNIENDYYFPIKVSSDKIYQEAGKVGMFDYVLEMGMNKTTKPHASNKITIDGIDNIIADHLHKISLYYGFATPLMAYNRIMNKQVDLIGENDTQTNMLAQIKNVDLDFEKYMDKLWLDIQGITNSDKGFVSKGMSYIRWATANSALGLNPKVLMTQTLSLASALSEFNPKYVAKGMGHFFGEADKQDLAKYSPLMWERMQVGFSVDVADVRQVGKELSQGKILAKTSKALTDLTTKPISWMDSNVIQSLWFAAQNEVADTKGLKLGSEENKVEAGKRLDEVVFRTQQTSDALGRSEWMRSQNEIIKFARMFTGDAIQLTGRMISSVNQYNIAKTMIKSGDAELVQEGNKLLEKAKRTVAKSTSAFVLNHAMLLAIALAFKWLKGKNDDEEWDDIAKNEVLANLFGLIPFGSDVYDKLLGYEPTNMAYTALSSMVQSVQDLYEGTKSLISGEQLDEVKLRNTWRKNGLSITRLFGIPAQNLQSYTGGIIEKISPKTKEEMEAKYKTKSNAVYLEKIRKATEAEDEDLAEALINIMFGSKTGRITDDKVMDETRELIEQGYDVIPRVLGNKVSYDGIEYELTSRQHKQFEKIYSQSTEAVKSMVNSSTYNRLSKEAKAKAMNYIYNYYWNLAIEDMLGEDLETKTLLFAEAIPIEQLAMAVSQAQVYTTDSNAAGKIISGSRKRKIQNFVQSLRLSAVQKYMIMGYLGYSNQYGEQQVKSYINRLILTKSQKIELFEMSGYKVA